MLSGRVALGIILQRVGLLNLNLKKKLEQSFTKIFGPFAVKLPLKSN